MSIPTQPKIHHLSLPSTRPPLLKSQLSSPPAAPSPVLPISKSHTHPSQSPSSSSSTTGSVYFIGNATTLITTHGGIRILTDPNFLHAGDHVHLGPGVTSQRLKDPAVELEGMPPVDLILLSHYHEDHFDRVVEERVNRGVPVVTTPHARGCLEGVGFTRVVGVDVWEGVDVDVKGKGKVMRITGMPGRHVPGGVVLGWVNEVVGAVPPTNGWMVEFGMGMGKEEKEGGYRIYISGDTLFVDELRGIPEWLRGERVDLMLVHLGGTTIPGPGMPLVMVTMDAVMGVQLMRLVRPEVTVPVHFDDYDVMVSGLDEFVKEVEREGLGGGVVVLGRGEEYKFEVRGGRAS